jgi:protein TonB
MQRRQLIACSTSGAVHMAVIAAMAVIYPLVSIPEYAASRGTITLAVASGASQVEEQPARWHVHVPILKQDHVHAEPQPLLVHKHVLAIDTTPPTPDELLSTAVALPRANPPAVRRRADPRHPSPPSAVDVARRPVPRRVRTPRVPETLALLATPVEESRRNDQPGAAVDRLPRKLPNNPSPPYPAEAHARWQQGRVLLEVRVSEFGRVVEARVAESSGFPLLDAAALETAREWRFEPARQGARPIPYTIRLPIRFSIRGAR